MLACCLGGGWNGDITARKLRAGAITERIDIIVACCPQGRSYNELTASRSFEIGECIDQWRRLDTGGPDLQFRPDEFIAV